jgi:hypothetical protein
VLTEREQIVREVLDGLAALLDEREPRLPELVDAPTLAQALHVEVHSVYRHARELGAVKIGSALRFDPTVAIARATLKPDEPAPAAPRRIRRTAGDDPPLLPIR